MSGSRTNTFSAQPPPSHHIHRDSEVLPGAEGTEIQAAPYEVSATSNSQSWKPNNENLFGAGLDTSDILASGQNSESPDVSRSGVDNVDSSALHQGGTPRHDAFHEERPMNVKPATEGGVAVGGEGNLPEGHASLVDKMIGKTQKIAGKAMKNPQMHEKGELREAGGKDAVQGKARAPHD